MKETITLIVILCALYLAYGWEGVGWGIVVILAAQGL